jgi:hypothetical protein
MNAMGTALRARPLHKGGDLLYSLDGAFSEIIAIGLVADGFRLNGHFGGPVTAGDLTGAQVTGVDYFRIRHDGLGVVRAHEVVTAAEGVIAVELNGFLRPPEGVEAPLPTNILQPGFTWPEQPYTIHVSATFETAAADLDYLNETVVAHSGTVNFTTGRLHIDARVIG